MATSEEKLRERIRELQQRVDLLSAANKALRETVRSMATERVESMDPHARIRRN